MRSLAILSLFLCLFSIQTTFAQTNSFSEDFLEFWADIKDNYAYLEEKQTDWNKVREIYLPRALHAKDSWELITVFEAALEEVYDHHLTLGTNIPSSTKLFPSASIIWAEFIEDKPVITGIKSESTLIGAEIGMEIIAINGLPVKDAVEQRMGQCIPNPDIAVRNFALQQALSGTHLKSTMVSLKKGNETINVSLEEPSANQSGLLGFSMIQSQTGYIRFNNSLGNDGVIALFDSALASLRHTRSLIIDLRDTPSGGNSVVARAILGRFISEELPYQKHELPREAAMTGITRSWFELVSPRGPFQYKNKVVILVDRWTGSMGEGIAVGFNGLKRAEIIGTRMAGLNGAIYRFTSTRTKIPYSIPVEKIYHINGQAREKFCPNILIDLMKKKYQNTKDPILQEAMLLCR